jgi:transposase-like protein
MENRIDYEALKNKALRQLKSGQPLTGKGGAFAPLLKEFLEAALESELEDHLDEKERQVGNRRNGLGRKTVKSSEGSFEVSTPRDRSGNFEPEIIRKRETILAESLESKIIGLCYLGTSLRDISFSGKRIVIFPEPTFPDKLLYTVN